MQSLEIEGVRMVQNEPMSRHTTLQIGGPADAYAEIHTAEQLNLLLKQTRENNLTVFFIGNGSNLLVHDAGIRGIVVRLCGDFEEYSVSGTEVRAGAGVLLPTLVKQCADRGLGGIEPLIGVPGTVGGALVMNAGVPDLWICQVLKSAEVLNPDGRMETLPAAKIESGYRWTSLAGRAICFATLQLKEKKREEVLGTVQKYLDRRLQTQPIGTLNVGSIFKNPKDGFAAELIERAGLKGKKKGGAQVSPKHANFIVNCGGAKAEDVRGLVFEIQKEIQEKYGVALEPEIKMVGW